MEENTLQDTLKTYQKSNDWISIYLELLLCFLYRYFRIIIYKQQYGIAMVLQTFNFVIKKGFRICRTFGKTIPIVIYFLKFHHTILSFEELNFYNYF